MKLLLRDFCSKTDTQKTFDCGSKPDLNDFLTETSSSVPNATNYEKELLAVTYVLEDLDTHSNIAYFSLLYDKVEREFVDPSLWNKMSRRIPNAKRRSSYPALKIGRLAVSKKFKGLDIGTKIINYIEAKCLRERFAGCRFITVDAYRDAEGFYQKCNFKYLVSAEPSDETVLMYIDLKELEL